MRYGVQAARTQPKRKQVAQLFPAGVQRAERVTAKLAHISDGLGDP